MQELIILNMRGAINLSSRRENDNIPKFEIPYPVIIIIPKPVKKIKFFKISLYQNFFDIIFFCSQIGVCLCLFLELF